MNPVSIRRSPRKICILNRYTAFSERNAKGKMDEDSKVFEGSSNKAEELDARLPAMRC